MNVATLVLALLHAQITGEPVSPYPDATKFARGIYSEAEVGAVMFVGEARTPMGTGAAVGARVGYDLFRWAAVQVHTFGSSHVTHFPRMPQSGQLLQLYQGTVELKLTARFGQIAAAAMGGAGMARLSTNLLGTAGLTDPDVRNLPVLLGGLTVDYHTLSRHFSFGLGGNFAKYQRLFTTGAVAVTAFARYTF